MSFPYEIADWQTGIISTAVGGIIGFLASFIIEWYKKKKLPRMEDRDAASQLVTATKDNIATTQSVIDLLEGRLEKERLYYDTLIDRSKKDCEDQIIDMKKIYDDIVGDLQAQIITGNMEKNELSKQVEKLTEEKTTLQKEVSELKDRLTKYEKKGTGPLLGE